MNYLRVFIFCCSSLLASPGLAETVLSPDEAAIKAHLDFLADDALRGRDPASPDYAVAAAYVATRMAEAGLKPAGDHGSWYQSVPLIVSRPLGESTLSINGVPLAHRREFIEWKNFVNEDLNLSAPVIFAGYGVVDSLGGENDFNGLDCRGKIVAVFYGAPTHYPSEVNAHLGDLDLKVEAAKRCGAIGVVGIESDAVRKVYPLERAAENWKAPDMTLADPGGQARDADPPLFAFIGLASAHKLFAGSNLNWDEIAAADRAGKKLPSGPLAVTLTFRQKVKFERLTSPNAVGRLEGSDSALKAEHVVFTAHLDHLGVGGVPIAGDDINNGAIDNAIGVAVMLEAAKRFRAERRIPKRSLLFLAVTAEEEGLLGSEYFAQHPTVAKDSLVANFNVDAPLLTYEFRDLIAVGAERSTLASLIAPAVTAKGYQLVPDPHPEQGIFVRSDNYSFVREGIPSVSIWLGNANGGGAASAAYSLRYHRPNDDASQPFDWRAANAFVDLAHDVAAAIANAPQRPRWLKGDYFGRLYNGFGAQ